MKFDNSTPESHPEQWKQVDPRIVARVLFGEAYEDLPTLSLTPDKEEFCQCEKPLPFTKDPGLCRCCLNRIPAPPPAPTVPHTPTLTDAAEAVLLFHSAGPWTEEKRQRWQQLTGAEVATTATLCETCRAALKGGRA